MKIHEYQGKDIFKSYGIPIQDGYVIENIEDASATIEKVQQEFNTEAVVVKAQIHAGGRGKGGGVKYSPTTAHAVENAQNMLGMQLVTHQTGTEGQKVRKLYITEALDIKKEYYCAITLDRSQTKDVFMVSSEGGVEIEKVAEETPEKIIKVWIDPLIGMKSFQARKLAFGLELTGDAFKTAVNLNYIKLDGNVGCMVNGAGLAMATMDIIKLAGGEPANFLDVGGTASAETVKNGFKIILSDEHVKAILINIFGGIVRCDRVATGVIQAVKELGLKVPVVVRLEGTNAEGAKTILSESGLDIIPANDMKDAAQKVVDAAIKN